MCETGAGGGNRRAEKYRRCRRCELSFPSHRHTNRTFRRCASHFHERIVRSGLRDINIATIDKRPISLAGRTNMPRDVPVRTSRTVASDNGTSSERRTDGRTDGHADSLPRHESTRPSIPRRPNTDPGEKRGKAAARRCYWSSQHSTLLLQREGFSS